MYFRQFEKEKFCELWKTKICQLLKEAFFEKSISFESNLKLWKICQVTMFWIPRTIILLCIMVSTTMWRFATLMTESSLSLSLSIPIFCVMLSPLRDRLHHEKDAGGGSWHCHISHRVHLKTLILDKLERLKKWPKNLSQSWTPSPTR